MFDKADSNTLLCIIFSEKGDKLILWSYSYKEILSSDKPLCLKVSRKMDQITIHCNILES